MFEIIGIENGADYRERAPSLAKAVRQNTGRDEAVNDGNTNPLQLGSFVKLTGGSHSREEGTGCRRQHTAASFR